MRDGGERHLYICCILREENSFHLFRAISLLASGIQRSRNGKLIFEKTDDKIQFNFFCQFYDIKGWVFLLELNR